MIIRIHSLQHEIQAGAYGGGADELPVGERAVAAFDDARFQRRDRDVEHVLDGGRVHDRAHQESDPRRRRGRAVDYRLSALAGGEDLAMREGEGEGARVEEPVDAWGGSG